MARAPSSKPSPAPVVPTKPAAVTTMKPASQVTQPSPASTPVSRDKIAMRAYEKWCQRGQPCDGSDARDWLEAEQELVSQSRQTTRR